MKRLSILAAIFAACIVQAKTQIYADIGVRAGINLSTVLMDDGLKKLLGYPALKSGFMVGLALDIHFTDELYLMSGLNLTQTGYNATRVYSASELGTPALVEYKMRANPLYLHVPLYFANKISLGSDIKLVPQIGP